MQARLLIEPQIAREAALNATAGDIGELTQCMLASRHAQTWRQYENCDNRLHRAVAEAAHNTVLLALFDTLNAVRRAVVWGRLRDKIDRPPAPDPRAPPPACRGEARSEEHTSELQSLMRISYAVFCLKKKKTTI